MLPQIFLRWASRLRLPWLTAIVGFLFVSDLIIPDFIPLADELVLGLATTLLVRWKKERSDGDIIDVSEVPPPTPRS
jgi:hypothetical protein